MKLDEALKVSAVEAKLDGGFIWPRAILPYYILEKKDQSKSILVSKINQQSYSLVWTTTLAPVRGPRSKATIGKETIALINKSEEWEPI